MQYHRFGRAGWEVGNGMWGTGEDWKKSEDELFPCDQPAMGRPEKLTS